MAANSVEVLNGEEKVGIYERSFTNGFCKSVRLVMFVGMFATFHVAVTVSLPCTHMIDMKDSGSEMNSLNTHNVRTICYRVLYHLLASQIVHVKNLCTHC